MVRRYNPNATPATPAITDPALFDREEVEGVSCECGCVIAEAHLTRHRRSKKHTTSLNWVRTQMLIAVAEANQRADRVAVAV